MNTQTEKHPLDSSWCVQAWSNAIAQMEPMLQSLQEYSQDRGRAMPLDDRFLWEARTITVGSAAKRGVMSWMTQEMDPEKEIIITDSDGYREELRYRFQNERGVVPPIYLFPELINKMSEVKQDDYVKQQISRVVVITTERSIRGVDRMMSMGWVSFQNIDENIKIIHFV